MCNTSINRTRADIAQQRLQPRGLNGEEERVKPVAISNQVDK